MNWLVKIEKALFYFFIAVCFWQWRLIWPGGENFNEWAAFFLYATDIILAAIFILWGLRLILSFVKRAAEGRGTHSPFPKGSTAVGGERFKSSAPLLRGTSFIKGGINTLSTLIFRSDTFLYLFLFFCALSVFIALDKSLALFRFIKLIEFIGLYFYVHYNFNALYSIKKFWQWFIGGAALQSVVAIAQFLTQKSLGLKFFAESPLAPNLDSVAKIVIDGTKFIRAYGLVPHPNILAAILAVAIFGLVWLFIVSSLLPERSPVQRDEVEGRNPSTRYARSGNKLGRKLFFILIFILLSVALFFTFSRGIIIVGGVVFIVWLACLWRQKENRRAVLGVFLLFAICYSLLAIIYWPYVSSRYDPADLPGSQAIDLRVFYNAAAWDFIKTNPWLGVGPGNFVVALREAAALPDWQYQPAHNIYLLVAAENGVPALLAFLAFLFLTVRSAWISRRNLETGYWLFAISYLLIIGLFDHFLWDLQQGQILFWLVLGLLAASLKKQDAEKI